MAEEIIIGDPDRVIDRKQEKLYTIGFIIAGVIIVTIIIIVLGVSFAATNKSIKPFVKPTPIDLRPKQKVSSQQPILTPLGPKKLDDPTPTTAPTPTNTPTPTPTTAPTPTNTPIPAPSTPATQSAVFVPRV